MGTFKFNEKVLRKISILVSGYSAYYLTGFIAGGFIGLLRLKREEEKANENDN